MKIVNYCYSVMVFLTLWAMVSNNSFITASEYLGTDTNLLINGTSTTIQSANMGLTFSIDNVQGFLSGLVIIGTIVSVIGIRVLGSGLSDFAVGVLSAVVFHTGMWSLLTILAGGLIDSITTYGVPIWIAMTVLFVVGIGLDLFGGGGDSDD